MGENNVSEISNTQSLRALIVDDSEDDVLLIIRELKKGGYNPVYERVETAEAMKKTLEDKQWDIILCDYKMPDFSAPSAITLLKKINIDIPIIIISGAIGEETAVECMRSGARDYIMKGNFSRLCPVIAREIEEAKVRNKRKQAEEELRESEGKYRTILEDMQEAYFEVDLAGTITFVNNAACRDLGYSKDELIGMNYRQYTDQENAKILFQAYNKVYTSGEPLKELSWQITRKDGTKRYIEGSASLKKDSSGKPTGFKGIDRDITERKQAEEALSESERKLREAQKISHLGHWIWDVKTGKVEWSEEVFKIFQLNPDSFTPQIDSIQDLSPWPEDHERDKELIRKATESHESGSYEQRFLRPDKSTGYYFSSFQGKYDDNGNLVSIVGTVQDITERIQAEERLKQGQQELQALMDVSPIGICWADMKGNIQYNNQKFRDLFGYTVEDIPTIAAWRSQAYPDPAYREQIPSLISLLTEAQKQGKEADPIEVTVTCKDGSIRHVLQAGAFTSNRILVTYADITERRQKEQALRETERRFAAAFHASPNLISITRLADGKIVDVNEGYSKMLGYSRDESIGKTTIELSIWTNPADRATFIGGLNKFGEITDFETTLRLKDGTVITVLDSARTIELQGEKCFLSVVHDITERKQAEEALKERESKYRLLADNIDDVIFVLDINLNYTYASPSVKKLMGYEPEEFVNLRFSETMTSSSCDMALRKYSEKREIEISGHREIDKPTVVQLEMKRKDGSTVWTEAKTSFIRDENQHPVGVICVSRDITERKQIDEKLQQTLDNLRRAIGTTINVLVSALEARDPYTAGHQLRVADLARAIATEMKLPQDKIDGIRMAGSIHDIGKLSIPAEILVKPTKLTNLEFSLIKEHSLSGYEMLKDVESPWPLAQIVYQHHERMNGSGYPRNLKGDEIIMEARIMAVADVVEAMASHRPYRAALGVEIALEEIEKNKGVLYDDAVADACLRLFREKDYQLP